MPIETGDALVGGLEGGVEVALVEVSFEAGDVAELAIVAAHLVEDFDEDREKCVHLGLADHIGFLIDVEEDASRRDAHRFGQFSLENRVVAALGQEEIQRFDTVRGRTLCFKT